MSMQLESVSFSGPWRPGPWFGLLLLALLLITPNWTANGQAASQSPTQELVTISNESLSKLLLLKQQLSEQSSGTLNLKDSLQNNASASESLRQDSQTLGTLSETASGKLKDSTTDLNQASTSLTESSQSSGELLKSLEAYKVEAEGQIGALKLERETAEKRAKVSETVAWIAGGTAAVLILYEGVKLVVSLIKK